MKISKYPYLKISLIFFLFALFPLIVKTDDV